MVCRKKGILKSHFIFKKTVFLICFLIVSCVQSKITPEMREGLKFNYKETYLLDTEIESRITVSSVENAKISKFTFLHEGYGCPEYLGGYYQKNDTLYLCFQNMNPDSKKLKCVDYFKLSYEIDNQYLNYKYLKKKEIH